MSEIPLKSMLTRSFTMLTFRFIFAIFLLTIVAAAFWDLHIIQTPVAIPPEAQTFSVNLGDSFDLILHKLHVQHVVDNPLAVKIYLKLTGQNPNIMAGTYSFPATASPLDILERLKQGGRFDRITIVEGWNRFDIADAMLRAKVLGLQSRQQALQLFGDTHLIKDVDKTAGNLEGYLFPDTYFLAGNSTPGALVSSMVTRFKQVWRRHLQKDAAKNGISVHDAVVVASLIETEAKLPSERPIVASVIFNRIKAGMPLSIDSSLVYASKLAGAWRNDGKVYQSDIDRASPYNTRRNVGLPPGPVGSPGLASLSAAVHPAHTDFLYYVRDPKRNDGAHNFYKDEKTFGVGVAALRAWERHQKQVGGSAKQSVN